MDSKFGNWKLRRGLRRELPYHDHLTPHVRSVIIVTLRSPSLRRYIHVSIPRLA
jgi:hypothetical protein